MCYIIIKNACPRSRESCSEVLNAVDANPRLRQKLMQGVTGGILAESLVCPVDEALLNKDNMEVGDR